MEELFLLISYGEAQAAGPQIERLLIVATAFVAALLQWGPRRVDATIVRVDRPEGARTVVWPIDDADDAFWRRVDQLRLRHSRA